MRYLVGITLLISLSFSLASSVSAMPSTSAMAASVEIIEDGVEIQYVDTEEWIPLTSNNVVAEGDRLRTDETGTAMIVWFDDGTMTELQANTELEIITFNVESKQGKDASPFNIATRIISGRVIFGVERLIDANSSFTVETPNMTASVRGTLFAIDVQETSDTSLIVTEGIVMASRSENEAVAVEAGNWLPSAPGVALSAAQPIDNSGNDAIMNEYREQIDRFSERRDERRNTNNGKAKGKAKDTLAKDNGNNGNGPPEHANNGGNSDKTNDNNGSNNKNGKK